MPYLDERVTALEEALEGLEMGERFEEVPLGTRDGSNTLFTLIRTPDSEGELFWNGLLREEGPGKDYTREGASLTLWRGPEAWEQLRFRYRGAPGVGEFTAPAGGYSCP